MAAPELAGRRVSVRPAPALLVAPAGMLLNVAVKDSVQRARPAWNEPLVQPASYSFPSGHALAATVFYGVCCVLVFARTRSRAWRAVAAAVAAFMVLLAFAALLAPSGATMVAS